jgi:hypothetical protein
MTNLAMDDRYFPLATAKGGAYLDPRMFGSLIRQLTKKRSNILQLIWALNLKQKSAGPQTVGISQQKFNS